MNQKLPRLFSLFCLCLLPASALAQCPRSTGTEQDKLCWSLQYILYAAQTDYREFRAPHGPAPDVSLGTTKVPCQVSAWLNNVAMYMCSADVSLAEGQEWYTKTMASLQQLQYLWHFKIESPGADHFVDAGPPDCEVPTEVPPRDGPYFGQCPLHLQEVRQPDGTAKVYLWVNSYTSPYLALKPPLPAVKYSVQSTSAPQSAGPSASIFPTCDDLCRELKQVLEARVTAFQKLLATNSSPGASNVATRSEVTVKLAGASDCAIDAAPLEGSSATTASRTSPSSFVTRSGSLSTAKFRIHGAPAQYVCYWPEDSESAAETRFRDLSSRIQVAMPSDWSARQEDTLDSRSGAKLTLWLAIDPANKPAVRLYLSGQSVGLHISDAD